MTRQSTISSVRTARPLVLLLVHDFHLYFPTLHRLYHFPILLQCIYPFKLLLLSISYPFFSAYFLYLSPYIILNFFIPIPPSVPLLLLLFVPFISHTITPLTLCYAISIRHSTAHTQEMSRHLNRRVHTKTGRHSVYPRYCTLLYSTLLFTLSHAFPVFQSPSFPSLTYFLSLIVV